VIAFRQGSAVARAKRAARLLHLVDELEPEATGAFVFSRGGREGGVLLVERRRVCWAIAVDLSRHLVDFLNDQADRPVSAVVLEELIAECRSSSRPFGELLVERGHVSSAGLRSALLEQTVEAVVHLSEHPWDARFLPHKRSTYDARYSFSTGELYGALGREEPEESVRREGRGILNALIPMGASGLIFSRPPGMSPRLLDLMEGRAVSATDVLSLSRWAESVLDVAGVLSEGVHMVAAADGRGAARVAFRRRHFLGVAICPDAPTLARVLMQQTLG
jgi:hypothetical protein